jgi:hypothetical protein
VGALLAIEQENPTIFDAFHFQALTKWLPDELEHIHPISDMSVIEAKRLFYPLSPLMLSCWGCLAATIGKNAMPKARASDRDKRLAAKKTTEMQQQALGFDMLKIMNVLQKHLTTVRQFDATVHGAMLLPFAPGPRIIFNEVA